MHRPFPTFIAAAALAAGVFALSSPTSFAASSPAAAAAPAAPAGGAMRARHRGGRAGLHAPPAVRASMRDMIAIERLYRQGGKRNELPAFYSDVLARTQNPMLREFARRRLARLQSAPVDTSAAIATLRQGLDENLKLAERAPAPR